MIRILIADDSIVQRRFLKKGLQGKDYEILEATNGHDVLQKIEEYKPDCVLLDLLMPELSGVQVLEKLHAKKNHTPVIVLTADIQDSTIEQCKNLGAKFFFNKPFEEELILKAIQSCLSEKL